MNKSELVTQLFELTGAGDWDAVAPYLHPDFEVSVAPCHSYYGKYRGLEGFKEIFRKVFQETYAEFVPQFIELAEGPNHVVALLKVKVTGKRSGRTLNTTLAEVFRFEDGKLRETRPHYFDTKALVDLD